MISDQINRELEKLDTAFNRKTSTSTLAFYKKKIVEWDVPIYELREAIDRCCISLKTFPTLATIREHLPRDVKKNTSHVNGFTKEQWAQFEREKTRLEEIRKFFDGEDDKKKKYVRYWCKLAMGDAFEKMLALQGLTFMTFEKPALFDLADNNYKLEHLDAVVKRKAIQAQQLSAQRSYHNS